ncbi:type I-F CRISPR-associated protein Csy2 [Acetobacteraceae bacterium]|nr:type I-F CRISPR-associated protein Csy2 [Acetobacteraceae bacterium]
MSSFFSKKLTDYLILPHLRIQNANAITGPFTHGFPAITAFMGLMWALERRCQKEGLEIAFKNVGVIAYQTQELVKEDRYNPAVFHLTRNRVRANGTPLPIQEEGRMHLEISLIFGVNIADAYLSEDRRKKLAKDVLAVVHSMRIAGGIILPNVFPSALPAYQTMPSLIGREKFEKEWKRQRNRFLPGFALIERADLIEARLKTLQEEHRDGEPNPTKLDAWLSLCAINWRADEVEENGEVKWYPDRQKGSGWVVPIPVGYAAISPLHEAGTVKDSRDDKTSFQAVESLQSIGEWKFPPTIKEVSELLWGVENDLETGLYRCRSWKEISEKRESLLDEDDDELSG